MKPLKLIEFFGVKSALSDILFEKSVELEDGCMFCGDLGEVWKSAKSSSSKLARVWRGGMDGGLYDLAGKGGWGNAI